MANKGQSPHIVFLSISTPFTIPIGELAKLLVLRRGFTATFITLSDMSGNHAQAPFLDTLTHNGITHETVPPLNLHDLPTDMSYEHRFTTLADRAAPFIASLLENVIKTKSPVALVIDAVSAVSVVDIAKKLSLPCYLFFTINATAFSYCYHLPEIEEKTNCEYRHLAQPLSLPGCINVHGKDFLVGSQERDSEANKAYLRVFTKYREVDGVLLNSFVEMEPEPYKALKDEEKGGEVPPIYGIGPILSRDGWGDSSDECLKWLDGQPNGSVLYISFGAGGTLSPQQTAELAAGLEQSGQRFLWVVRSTSEKDGTGAFFNLKAGKEDPLSCLPNGFVERSKGKGFFVTHWAPQVYVLRHKAVGGFLTHCGWSSVLESIYSGVPMIAWPLHGEQRINAVLMSEAPGGLGVALRPRAGDDGVVRRGEVASVVKELMGGEGRKKVKANLVRIRAEGEKAVGEGGSAYEALSSWCARIAG